MAHSQPKKTTGGFTRRDFLKVAGATGAGLVLAPTILAAAKKGADAPAAGGPPFYEFVNNTKGKFSDDKIFYTFDGKTYTSMAESKTAPARMGGGGRIYFCLGGPSKQTGNGQYADFIEYTHGNTGWYGNTTLVDEFIIPFTIELFSAGGAHGKVGIEEPRTKLFEAFAKESPKEWHTCIKGTDRIVSPCRADFGRGKQYENYFAKYIDEIWEKYATKKVENGWTKEVVGTALTFTPSGGGKPEVCPSKPKSTDAFLGEGIIQNNPHFCGAINRHVLGEPEFWRDPSKFYLSDPCNHYSKFWHAHSLLHKAYGFSYDDAMQQDTLLHYTDPVKLVVTINWD
jgi:hypothetical protein